MIVTPRSLHVIRTSEHAAPDLYPAGAEDADRVKNGGDDRAHGAAHPIVNAPAIETNARTVLATPKPGRKRSLLQADDARRPDDD